MAEEFFVHSLNGQEVEQADINLMASVGGLADDRVLAELLRLAPFNGTVAKAVLPFGHTASALPTVGPAGASGAVIVAPFRAIVGSRDAFPNLGPKLHWSDLRSGIFVGTGGALGTPLPLAANPTGFPRWDLVYAVLAVDADGAKVDRYRKDPTTEQVAVVSVVRTKVQSVTVNVVQGASAAAPQKPALPGDGNGAFYFPLAYVRVPAGFNATSIVAPADIDEVIPYVPLARTTGAATLVPANQQNKEGGTVLASSGFGWTGAAGQRPGPFLPPTMAGMESVLIALDLADGTPANWSHGSGAVVDDSRDWRNRLFRWLSFTAAAPPGVANSRFAWDPNDPFASVTPTLPSAVAGPTPSVVGFGQSFQRDAELPFLPLNKGVVLALDPSRQQLLAANTSVQLYVDPQGALRVNVAGVPNCRLFVWLDATAPFPNF